MRIGITGATGFIGSALGRKAVEHGHEVVAFSRRTDLSLSFASEVRRIHDHGEALDVTGLDALVHLAGESVMGLWTSAKRKRIRESRVVLTHRIVEALKNTPNGPTTFVCASGSGAYGDGGDKMLTENQAFGSDFLARVCVDWETAAAQAEEAGIRVVHLRTGMVLGNGGGAWPFLKKLFSLRLGAQLGSGRQWVPWIHLNDETGIILHTLENPAYRGPVNLASPNPVTNAEMTKLIAQSLDRATLPAVPGFVLKLLVRDLASVVLSSQRVMPKTALSHGYTFEFPLFQDALADLNAQP